MSTANETVIWNSWVTPVVVTATASPASVYNNNSDTVEFSWTSREARSCTIGNAAASLGNSRMYGPYTSTGNESATVTCENPFSTQSASASWRVTSEPEDPPPPVDPPVTPPPVTPPPVTPPPVTPPPVTPPPVTPPPVTPPAPTAVTITASLSLHAVKSHADTVDLTWSGTNAASCARDGRALTGTEGTVTGLGPFHDGAHDIVITCKGSGGETASRTVTVRASAVVACSAYPAAPVNAENLALGEYVYSITGTTGGAIYGTDVYTDDSHISKAVVHAGLVAGDGTAIIRLTRLGRQSSFRASTQNGVFSEGWGNWPRSYSVALVRACGGAAPTVPQAPAGLTSSENPSPDGSFDLSWTAPASGTAPTGYLVYPAGSKTGYLGKSFAARTVSLSDLDNATYEYKAFACVGAESDPDCGPAATLSVTVAIPDTDSDGILDPDDEDDDNDGMSDACELTYGFDPRDAADGGSTNTDGDGATNAHECAHGTDPTATPGASVMPDGDSDGMHDAWEANNGLDADSSADALHDSDGDGFNNLEEFTAGTDPRWADSRPNSAPEVSAGFNASYTAQTGLIDADTLTDILIRNPAANALPAVPDFVLVQQEAGGFNIEDASSHTMPSTLTSIGSPVTIGDFNGDGGKDLLLSGLSGSITGANDRIVFSRPEAPHALPTSHVGLPAAVKQFFLELSGWVDNANYFETNAILLATVPAATAMTPLTDANGNARLGTAQLADSLLRDASCTVANTGCFHVYGDRADFRPLTLPDGAFEIEYAATRLDVKIRDSADSSAADNVYGIMRVTFAATDSIAVRDYSGFNADALLLAEGYLAPVRTAGSLRPGAAESLVVSRTLSAYLAVPVFGKLLLGPGDGILPEIADSAGYSGVSAHDLNVLGFVHDRIALSKPTAMTAAEIAKSPDLDVLGTMPDCWPVKACNADSFTAVNRKDIQRRLEGLSGPLTSAAYASAEAAAIALHGSDLHAFATALGIEFGAVIERTATGAKIDKVFTAFDSKELGVEATRAGGKTLWRNQPNKIAVTQGDAVRYAELVEDTICAVGTDYMLYASGANLTRAKVKQTVGIAAPATFRFAYEQRIDGVWKAATSPADDSAGTVSFDCAQ